MKKLIIPAMVLMLASFSQAALIAHYDFSDGDLLDNEQGASYTLTKVTTGTGDVSINPDGSAAFTGSEDNKGYLETPAYGSTGLSHFTVSFWWKTSSLAQGNYQGLFSNGPNIAYSWQLDNTGADFRFVSNGATMTYAESNVSTDTWYHTVIRKETGAGDNFTQVYITPEGAVNPVLVMNQNANPGGLNSFRLGANRNIDSFFQIDMANVKIYNDSTVNLTTLLNEGIPEPATIGLVAAFGACMVFLRTRFRI